MMPRNATVSAATPVTCPRIFIAITHTGRRNLLDPFGQLGLPDSTGAVMVG